MLTPKFSKNVLLFYSVATNVVFEMLKDAFVQSVNKNVIAALLFGLSPITKF